MFIIYLPTLKHKLHKNRNFAALFPQYLEQYRAHSRK